MARPKKKANGEDKTAEELASIGCTMNEIGAVMGLSVSTLERRFDEPIKRGREKGRETLRRKQWDLAMKGHPTMLIWLGKQMLGQADKQALEHDFKGGVLVVGESKDPKEWEQLAKRQQALSKEGKGGNSRPR
jgi:hypothetical protein